ncbi:hypothetical protein [uncultured Duncaniella sp.]|uniref:hypothetical protein n=1 Tax=uncultured Duncaniella sp. TaxID=2768039 RepID=UPI0026208770|nr:hypothetical protein [uncultured Duncaniella sp.]
MRFIVERFIQLLNAHRSMRVTYEFDGDHYEVHFSDLPATVRARLRALTYESPTSVYDPDKNVYLSARHPVFIPNRDPNADLVCMLYSSDYAKKINEIDVTIRKYDSLVQTRYI